MLFRGSLYSISQLSSFFTEDQFDEAKHATETALDGSYTLAAYAGARDYPACRLADGVQYLESPSYSTRQGDRSRHSTRLHLCFKNRGEKDLAQSERHLDSGPQTVSLCRRRSHNQIPTRQPPRGSS